MIALYEEKKNVREKEKRKEREKGDNHEAFTIARNVYESALITFMI